MRPIAMRCNQEQFDKIKPKLEKNGIVIKMMAEFCCDSVKYYLINDFNEKLGTVTNVSNPSRKGRAQYETWNEQLFLEACGIKINNDMKITKEFIKANADKTFKEVFSEVFKTELIVGNWYWFKKTLFNYQLGSDVYGFNDNGSWCNVKSWSYPKEYGYDKEATNEEVFEALKNEALKPLNSKG